jgi:hypothetical protein
LSSSWNLWPIMITSYHKTWVISKVS